MIRQELANGRAGAPEMPAGDGAKAQRRVRSGVAVSDAAIYYSLAEVLEETRADPKLVAELEEYGVIKGRAARRNAATTTRPNARSSAPSASSPATASAGATCVYSAPPPIARRNLLQQILAPALRSRNPERRKEALEALDNLATVSTHLKHLLLVRDLRRIAG